MHLNPWIGLLSLAGLFVSCKTSVAPTKTPSEPETPTLVQIGDETYSPDAFFQSFTKNRFSSDSAKALTAAEYFEVFTKTRLKILAAEQLGRDTTSDFKEEIASYRDKLAIPYLLDKELAEVLIKEAYNRLKEEVKVSHILVAVPEDAPPADTLSAYRAAVALRGRLLEGSDFEEMATKFSKDPTVAENKGNLGYFTAFQMLYPFENVAYSTPVGQLSQPFRTRYGYHIIQVRDRRPSQGKLRVAHIMIQATPKLSEQKNQEAQQRIQDAYARLEKGETWEQLVQVYSDDFQSRQSGGHLPVFGVGEMMPAFEEAAYALAKIGDYSKPIKTPYGWHIIRLVEKIPLQSFEAVEPYLKQKVQTDSRGKLLVNSVENRLKSQYTIRENPDAWSEILELADSTLVKGIWKTPESFTGRIENPVLFTVEKEAATTKEFLDYTINHLSPRPAGSDPKLVLRSYYNDFLGKRLLEFEKANLESKYPEFKTLMKDIREGVLLSSVMEEQVLQRSLDDSTGQRRMYEQNKMQYTYPERAQATVVDARDTTILNQVLSSLAQPPYALQLKGEELLFSKGQTKPTARQMNSLFLLAATLKKNGNYLVEIAGYRTADEADTISSARIVQVVQFLNQQGIPITRIMEKDYGSFRPVPNPERNRRISFQFFSNEINDLQTAINLSNTPTSVRILDGLFAKENRYFKDAAWEVGEQILPQSDGRVLAIDIQSIQPARVKTFAEARGTVINAYQKILEKEWLDSLQTKFPVKVNEQELEKLIR